MRSVIAGSFERVPSEHIQKPRNQNDPTEMGKNGDQTCEDQLGESAFAVIVGLVVVCEVCDGHAQQSADPEDRSADQDFFRDHVRTRNIMFRQELYHHFKVSRLMTTPPARLYDTDSMEQVMEKFDETEAWNLPVVSEDGKYLGFVSKSNVFNAYREMMINLSDD